MSRDQQVCAVLLAPEWATSRAAQTAPRGPPATPSRAPASAHPATAPNLEAAQSTTGREAARWRLHTSHTTPSSRRERRGATLHVQSPTEARPPRSAPCPSVSVSRVFPQGPSSSHGSAPVASALTVPQELGSHQHVCECCSLLDTDFTSAVGPGLPPSPPVHHLQPCNHASWERGTPAQAPRATFSKREPSAPRQILKTRTTPSTSPRPGRSGRPSGRATSPPRRQGTSVTTSHPEGPGPPPRHLSPPGNQGVPSAISPVSGPPRLDPKGWTQMTPPAAP